MESKMIDLSTVVEIWPLCNTGAVLVHRIDYGEERVLASINGTEPEWCGMTEKYAEGSDDWELGFMLGSLFVPFSKVTRL